MKKNCFSLALVIAVFLSVGCKDKKTVFDQYHQAVVMVYHKYLYKVTINDNVWYLTKDNQNQYYWQKDPSKLSVGPLES